MTAAARLKTARAFLDSVIACDFAKWPELLTDDVVMRFPYSPPGIPNHCEGLAASQEQTGGIMSMIKSFAWHDIDLHVGEGLDIVFGTGRSEVTTAAGKPYGNQYCFIFRFRGDKIADYSEYFNPLKVLESFGPDAGDA